MNSSPNNSPIFVVSTSAAGTSSCSNIIIPNVSQPTAGTFRRRFKKNTSQPVIDVVVVLVALPTLMILALLLEANTRGNWLETSQTRFTVLGLGVALAVVCLAIVMYVTSRLGKKFLWTGPLPSETNGPHYSYYNPRLTVDELNDLPPSYEIVMGFDIPPPPYHTIVINDDVEKLDAKELETCPKIIAIQHI